MKAYHIVSFMLIFSVVAITLNACAYMPQPTEEQKKKAVKIAYEIGMTLVKFLLENQGIVFESTRDASPDFIMKRHENRVFIFEVRGGKQLILTGDYAGFMRFMQPADISPQDEAP